MCASGARVCVCVRIRNIFESSLGRRARDRNAITACAAPAALCSSLRTNTASERLKCANVHRVIHTSFIMYPPAGRSTAHCHYTSLYMLALAVLRLARSSRQQQPIWQSACVCVCLALKMQYSATRSDCSVKPGERSPLIRLEAHLASACIIISMLGATSTTIRDTESVADEWCMSGIIAYALHCRRRSASSKTQSRSLAGTCLCLLVFGINGDGAV